MNIHFPQSVVLAKIENGYLVVPQNGVGQFVPTFDQAVELAGKLLGEVVVEVPRA